MNSDEVRTIYCCQCAGEVEAYRIDAMELYPHRPDLFHKHFWRRPHCRNYVGCHPDTTKPLGCIPTYELMKARGHIHALIDPIWKTKMMSRRQVYARLSTALGYVFHNGEIRSIEEARKVYRTAREVFASYLSESHKCKHEWETHTSSEPVAAGVHVERYVQCFRCGEIREDKQRKRG